jgi:hypothetical protein
MAQTPQSLRNRSARLRAGRQELRRTAEVAFRHGRALRQHGDEAPETTAATIERGTIAKNDGTRVDGNEDTRMSNHP